MSCRTTCTSSSMDVLSALGAKSWQSSSKNEGTHGWTPVSIPLKRRWCDHERRHDRAEHLCISVRRRAGAAAWKTLALDRTTEKNRHGRFRGTRLSQHAARELEVYERGPNPPDCIPA